MPSIDNIDINARTIENCYKMFYPSTYETIKQNLFHYLNLWGIRVSSCDTSLPDDLVGGLRINNLNFSEIVVSKASTDPSPYYLNKTINLDALQKGGTAFVAEGQYTYRYMGSKHGKFSPLPSFCPTMPVKVYRWMPSADDKKRWNNGKGVPLSSLFETAVKNKKVTISTSNDVCIHKTWAKDKLWNDSAGCQVLTDDKTLKTLGEWAIEHQKKKFGNIFTYTLFTKEQFLAANGRGRITGTSGKAVPRDTVNMLQNLFNQWFK